MTNPSTPVPTDIERDPTHQAAAEWFVRLQGSAVSMEDTLAWQTWLSESPLNARAYARIEELSQVLRAVPPPALAVASAEELATDRYDASVPLGEWHEPTSRKPWIIIPALAAVVAGVAFSLVFWRTPTPNTFSTTVGETLKVTLSDGSTIALGGDTRIEVRLSKKLRSIELGKGEALFTVAKEPNRPFKVRVGDATIVAIGTAFDVQRDSDRAIVSVTEGRVMVEPVAHFLPVSVIQSFEPKLRTVHLNAGQQTIAGSAGIEEPTEVEDPAAATSWVSGRLAFRMQPLHYVLEDVNRYAMKPIVLEGEGLDAIQITGTVERSNIAGWVGSLERAFDLQVTEESDRIVIRPR
jgi:transmembrane sensor